MSRSPLDDEMDVKTYMDFHGIGLWPTDHDRLAQIFQRAGYRIDLAVPNPDELTRYLQRRPAQLIR